MSTKETPTVIQNDNIEDVQAIGTVESMYNSFVRSIDRYRSLSNAPGLGVNTNTSGRFSPSDQQTEMASRLLVGLNVSSGQFMESRAHAFYRMVGFPTASSSNNYYNSGHDPNQSASLKRRGLTNLALNEEDEEAVTLAQNREFQFKQRRNIFARQSDIASIYTLLSANPKPFLMMSDTGIPFEADQQTQPVAGRREQLEKFKISPDVTIPDFLVNVQHILKPFIVMPEIEMSVTEEYKRRICVPFLPDKASTRTTNENELKRPIIEYIIRQRLRTSEPSNAFTTRAKLLISDTFKTDSTDEDIRATLLALSGEDSVTSVDSIIFDRITSIESATILSFIKSIKVSVAELNKAIREVKEIREDYSMQPLPDVEGPEFRGKIITHSNIESISDLERKIATMELSQSIAEDLSALDAEDQDVIGGNDVFAGAFSVDTSKDFTKDISSLKRQRDTYGQKLLNSLRTIEIITGEISGIGLVDILAIYTALWAIDIRYLIGLLDNESLNRLRTHFPKLINNEVRTQLGPGQNRPSITESLQEFEKKLINILSFADKIFAQNNRSPRLARKGNIE